MRVFGVPRTMLQGRLNGRTYYLIARINNMKLTVIEEDLLENWILDLDLRGKAPSYAIVKDMANILLVERPYTSSIITMGKKWVY